nr:probable E3 ubiquitin-protein ligase LUL4 [Bactrocera oleae]
MEEYCKSRELELVINSDGALGKPKRKTKENVMRANLIAKAETDLLNGLITATSFLDRMVFSRNKIVTDMEPFERHKVKGLEYMEVESEVEEESNATEEGGANPPLICIICLENKPNILLLPCKHLKLCSDSTSKIEAESVANNFNKFKCPFCRQDVDEYLHLFI